jgi:hypothetical protein
MKKQKFITYIVAASLVVLLGFAVIQNTAFADTDTGGAVTRPQTGGTINNLPNPLGTESPQVAIGNVVGYALGLVGSLALVMFIYGGFMWLTAMGDPGKVTKGKEIFKWAVLGLIIIFASYSLVRALLAALSQA